MNFPRIKALHDKHEHTVLQVKPGMFLEIHEKIGEENNRLWRFKGLVIKVKNPQHADGTFTVRGTVAGVEVEKIYPLSFNKFAKLQVLDDYKIRRSKLYYIREKVGKAARFKSKPAAEKKEKNLLSKPKKKQ